MYFNEFKITIGVYESEMTHGGTESICVYRHNTHTKMGDTHTHIQQVNPWQYFSSLFEVASHGRQ